MRSNDMNKSRRTQPILVLVNDMADIEAVRVRAYDERNDELLGFVEAIRFAINLGIVGLPVEAQFLDSSDVVLDSAGKRIAVEVTRIAWTRQSAVIAGTTDKFPDAIVEMSAHLCDQGGAEGRLGDRTGSYAAIKRRHERLDSPGFAGDEAEQLTLGALGTAIERKNAKVDEYRRHAGTDRIWLFLIDDGTPGAIKKILSQASLRTEAVQKCGQSSFEHVLLFQFSGGTVDLSSL
jgi:hypothetical protein